MREPQLPLRKNKAIQFIQNHAALFCAQTALKESSFDVACWFFFFFVVFSSNKWFAKKRQDKCLIPLFNHIGIETGSRKESELIKLKRYPTLTISFTVHFLSGLGIEVVLPRSCFFFSQRTTQLTTSWNSLNTCITRDHLYSITTDNAANMKKAFQGLRCVWLGCLGHNLNLDIAKVPNIQRVDCTSMHISKRLHLI